MLSKHILPKSKAQPKQTRTERSEILSLSSSMMSQITGPSQLLCTLGSPLSTWPLHWIYIGVVMGHVKHEETDLPPPGCKQNYARRVCFSIHSNFIPPLPQNASLHWYIASQHWLLHTPLQLQMECQTGRFSWRLARIKAAFVLPRLLRVIMSH